MLINLENRATSITYMRNFYQMSLSVIESINTQKAFYTYSDLLSVILFCLLFFCHFNFVISF